MDNKTVTNFKKLKKIHYPITPFNLFSPVSTVFLDNVTYEEQLLGLYKLYNEFIEQYNILANAVTELQEIVDPIPGQIEALQKDVANLQDNITALQNAITSLQNALTAAINTLNQKIEAGDATTLANANSYTDESAQNTLAAANNYTDEQIANLPKGGEGTVNAGITAEIYDGTQTWAFTYDQNYKIPAGKYDNEAHIIMLSSLDVIYQDTLFYSVNLQPGGLVFDISNAPLKLDTNYLVEICFSNMSPDTASPIGLRMLTQLGQDGETRDFTVTTGAICGSVIKYSVNLPTEVIYRQASQGGSISLYDGFIRIKQWGLVEAH